ncbi:hypothetical protein Zmor_022514 [Zophobas morio]|uniref:Uncharacterized protein n=1 Tax=Zophobas morio TaxID=2755281 RepID=A0AA38M637_9CUCU|nr:hypothetical protein Zmor_022514 [Zophobas morio]
MISVQTLVFFATFYENVLSCRSVTFDYKIFQPVRMYETKIYNAEEISECYDDYFVVVDNQYIPELCCKFFACKNILKSIIFQNSFIREIEDNCFSNSVQNVRSLIEVSYNYLTTIKKHTFRDLVVLEISLRNNFIEELEDEAFLHLNNLLGISLENNRLKVINPKAFTLVPRLEHLSLTGNHISTLQVGVFSFLPARNSNINLACNKIVQLKKTAFDSLSSRITVNFNLNGNRIETLPEDIFNNHSFGLFDLGYNPLKKISRHFCEKQCVMERFRFDCTFLTFEDIEFIVDWAKVNEVDLAGSGCLQYNQSVKSWSTKYCAGAKNFEAALSWQLYVCFYLVLLFVL